MRSLARRITYPVVLKPAEGSGSKDILKVADAGVLLSLLTDEVRKTDHLLEGYIPDDVASDQWFANYLSAESVISAGRVSHVAITGRFPLAEPFRESGNFVPGILPPELHAPVITMVNDAIDALGIVNAVIHTEIKLTADGPQVDRGQRSTGRPAAVRPAPRVERQPVPVGVPDRGRHAGRVRRFRGVSRRRVLAHAAAADVGAQRVAHQRSERSRPTSRESTR